MVTATHWCGGLWYEFGIRATHVHVWLNCDTMCVRFNFVYVLYLYLKYCDYFFSLSIYNLYLFVSYP